MKSETSLFTDQQIVNRDNFRLSSQIDVHEFDSHIRHRSLFLFGTATGSICSLTPGKFYFEEDPSSGLYYWNSEKNDNLFHIAHYEYNFTGLKNWNETNITTSGRSITARACLCTLSKDRPVEFCSSEYLSCNVKSTPITCFTLSSTDTFIQSFWPVLLFWILIVLYSLYFTEAGKAARQYCRRKLLYGKIMQCMRGGTSISQADNNEAEQFVERTLDYMIEHNPSRVSNIYRERIYRQRRRVRYEQRREQWCWYKTWKKLRSLLARIMCCCVCRATTDTGLRIDGNSHDNVEVENMHTVEAAPEVPTVDDNSFSRLPSRSAPRLALKTKVYHEASANLTVHPLTDTVSPAEPVSNSVAASVTSWRISSVLAPFHRAAENDNVGMDEMDDEVEHGIRCAICLIRLRDGIDIIGDIPCNHCMHKQCLKEWLARKNRCPLCQLPDIADREQPIAVDVSPELGSHMNVEDEGTGRQTETPNA